MNRSVNTELRQGMTDGSYKQVVKDRGGEVEEGAYDSRRDLSVPVYGIVESLDKELPAGNGQLQVPVCGRDSDSRYSGQRSGRLTSGV